MPSVEQAAQGAVPSWAVGKRLVSVLAVAEEVFGYRITSRTVLRWCVNGRGGHRRPTLRGPQGRRVTTREVFEQWVAATSRPDDAPAVTVQSPKRRPVVDEAADAILAAFSPAMARKRLGGHNR